MKPANPELFHMPAWYWDTYVSTCPVCQKRGRVTTSAPMCRPSEVMTADECWQADLTFPTVADGVFKYILTIKDLGSKRVFSRALKTKTQLEVRQRLQEVALLWGRSPTRIHTVRCTLRKIPFVSCGPPASNAVSF
jgi:hypothetical protein